eukprot:GILK01002083.1.p1 GENE.GILK01002083.1~~GILK01002083.1.p1  ORF type:complete len:221 (+),score=24.29 GILK01002083.1:99-665(+)
MQAVASDKAKKIARHLRIVVYMHLLLCVARFLGFAWVAAITDLLACLLGYFAYANLNMCCIIMYLMLCSLDFIFGIFTLGVLIAKKGEGMFHEEKWNDNVANVTQIVAIPFYLFACMISWQLFKEIRSNLYSAIPTEDPSAGGGGYQGSYQGGAYQQPDYRQQQSSVSTTSNPSRNFVPFQGAGHRLG